MAEYTHLKCPVCSEEFLEDSDVVVCPICGTPHHRECYKNLGRCANIDWHSENKIYDAELERAAMEGEAIRLERERLAAEAREEQNAPIVCTRCGQKNESTALFCNNCGMPLKSGFASGEPKGQPEPTRPQFFAANPFTPPDPNEEFDGVKGWKLAAVVRDNQFSFMPKFRAFTQTGKKVSFNVFSLIFAPYYFFYRKMYGIGILALLLDLLCRIPQTLLNFEKSALSKLLSSYMDTNVSMGFEFTAQQMQILHFLSFIALIVSSAIVVLSGLFTNYLYYNKCKKLCNKIDREAKTREEFFAAADKKGGVNRAIIIVFIALMFIASWALTFITMNGSLNF